MRPLAATLLVLAACSHESGPPALCPTPVVVVTQSNEERAEAALEAAERVLESLESGGAGGAP